MPIVLAKSIGNSIREVLGIRRAISSVRIEFALVC